MKKKRPIELEIDRVIAHLSKLDPSSEEYKVASGNLKNLYEAQAKLPWWRIDPNVIFSSSISAGLGLVIVNNERFNVITSKALGYVKFR